MSNLLIKKEFLLVFDLIFFAVHFFYLSEFLPIVFRTLPATGGDTGSHFWPVYVLREYGLPNLNLRPWNPANFAGEPLLVHYFPFAFILMALFSYVMPAGLSFNLGTFLPVVLMPVILRWGICRFLIGIGHGTIVGRIAGCMAGILSWGWLLNESNSMWGGNIYSLFAGQFAHAWAFVFFAAFIGVLPQAFKLRERFLIGASVLFALIVLSHAYVALFVPVAMLAGFLLFDAPWISKFKSGMFVSILGSALSMWFWYPLLDNTKWTTPFAFEWRFTNYVKELVPLQMSPQIVFSLIWLLLLLFSSKLLRLAWRATIFWLLQGMAGIIGYFVFSKLGLVDIRALPQVQLAVTTIAAIAAGILYVHCGSRVRWLLALGMIVFPMLQWKLVRPQIVTLTNWAKWNYSGWTEKEGFASLKALSREIAGHFNDPRVAYEHDNSNNIAGTPRVFEMLPFFSGRSVGDGVYLQSTILAPMFFYHQATMSIAPSCPFSNYGCTKPDLDRAVELGALLGVDTFIIQSSSLVNSAENHHLLRHKFFASPWHVFQATGEPVRYVQVISKKPVPISPEKWRQSFWKWFADYKQGDGYLYVDDGDSQGNQVMDAAFGTEVTRLDCHPEVDISFGELNLKSDCPGSFHVLKFAYNSSWRSSAGEKLFLTSPGYIGLIPKNNSTKIIFGRSFSWLFANTVSVLAIFGLFGYLAQRYFKRVIAPTFSK